MAHSAVFASFGEGERFLGRLHPAHAHRDLGLALRIGGPHAPLCRFHARANFVAENDMLAFQRLRVHALLAAR